jgi:hypothetical protein
VFDEIGRDDRFWPGGDRSLDVSTPIREGIANKMENSGVPPQQTAKIRGFVPVGRSDRASLYHESLPPGLVLGQDDADR